MNIRIRIYTKWSTDDITNYSNKHILLLILSYFIVCRVSHLWIHSRVVVLFVLVGMNVFVAVSLCLVITLSHLLIDCRRSSWSISLWFVIIQYSNNTSSEIRVLNEHVVVVSVSCSR